MGSNDPHHYYAPSFRASIREKKLPVRAVIDLLDTHAKLNCFAAHRVDELSGPGCSVEAGLYVILLPLRRRGIDELFAAYYVAKSRQQPVNYTNFEEVPCASKWVPQGLSAEDRALIFPPITM